MSDIELEEQRPRFKNNQKGKELLYSIYDTPPWYLAAFLGFQHYLTMFGATVTIPFILTPLLCIENNDPSRSYIISTIFFVSGLVTIIQSTFGTRLPIIQGGTFSYLVPTIAILSLQHNKCPADFSVDGWKGNITYEEKTEVWQVRMREVQGAIIVSSLFQVVAGFTGLMGLIQRLISPLTIAPAVSMIGLSLFGPASDFAAKNWGVSFGTMFMMILFSQYLREVPVPVPAYDSNEKRWKKKKIYFFKLFPVLLTILIMWGICAILTYGSNNWPEEAPFGPNNPARTDLKVSLITESEWFRFPYPFQWGWPKVTIAGVFGMLAGVLAGAIESIGDYIACARLAGAPRPPTHAINRGIGMEGIGSLLAGIWGTGNGTTSYSENVGAIGVTKVGSRRVVQYGGLIMMLLGVFSKFGAVFSTIPDPIIGGIFYIMFGMIAAVGLSSLQHVDLNSSRNLFVLGFSLFFGLAFPNWMQTKGQSILEPENLLANFDSYSDLVKEAMRVILQISAVLLKTSMFLSALVGCILDNTIPGTLKERGIFEDHSANEDQDTDEKDVECYDFPIGMSFVRRSRWMRFMPFSPTFTGFKSNKVSPKRKE